jgi:hypothetical protein
MRLREETSSNRPVQYTCTYSINNTVGEPWTEPQLNLRSSWPCSLVIIFQIINMRYWPSCSSASHYVNFWGLTMNEKELSSCNGERDWRGQYKVRLRSNSHRLPDQRSCPIFAVHYSVADSGCLSRIRIFSITDPRSRVKKIRDSDPHQNI